MSVCLECGSRLGVEPDAREAAALVVGEVRKRVLEKKVDQDAAREVLLAAQPMIEESLRLAAEVPRRERSQVLGLLTRFAVGCGYTCGIAEDKTRIRVVPKWAKRRDVTDRGFEYRFVVWLDLPTGQVSWAVHDEDLSCFVHLLPDDGRSDGKFWRGFPAGEDARARVEYFARAPWSSFVAVVPEVE